MITAWCCNCLGTRGCMHVIDGLLQRQEESKENSLHMMKELNSVLAVRNVEKQQRREIRERKKLGQSHSLGETSTNSVPLGDHSECEASHLPSVPKVSVMAVPVSQEVGVATTSGEELKKHMTAATLENKELDKDKVMESETLETEMPYLPLLSSGGQLQFSSSSSAIAQAVASAALRTGRAGKEETFYDQDSSPSSDVEEDHYD